MANITDPMVTELIKEKRELLARLEEIDLRLRNNVKKYSKQLEAKMENNETNVSVEAVGKLTIAEPKVKTIEMLKAGKTNKEIMTALGVSSTYVHNVKKTQ
jgi:restriction endonuclease S subunit